MIAETFEIQSHGLSDKGRRRARNEDSLVLDPAHGVAVPLRGQAVPHATARRDARCEV